MRIKKRSEFSVETAQHQLLQNHPCIWPLVIERDERGAPTIAHTSNAPSREQGAGASHECRALHAIPSPWLRTPCARIASSVASTMCARSREAALSHPFSVDVGTRGTPSLGHTRPVRCARTLPRVLTAYRHGNGSPGRSIGKRNMHHRTRYKQPMHKRCDRRRLWLVCKCRIRPGRGSNFGNRDQLRVSV